MILQRRGSFGMLAADTALGGQVTALVKGIWPGLHSTLGPSLSNSGFIAAHLQLCKSWLTDSNTNSFRPREVEVNSVQGRDAPPSDGKAGFCIHLHLHFDILNLPINGPVYLDSPLIEL